MLRVTCYGNRHGANSVEARVPTFSIPACAQATSRWRFTRERRIGVNVAGSAGEMFSPGSFLQARD
jgi:hypothetical protein